MKITFLNAYTFNEYDESLHVIVSPSVGSPISMNIDTTKDDVVLYPGSELTFMLAEVNPAYDWFGLEAIVSTLGSNEGSTLICRWNILSPKGYATKIMVKKLQLRSGESLTVNDSKGNIKAIVSEGSYYFVDEPSLNIVYERTAMNSSPYDVHMYADAYYGKPKTCSRNMSETNGILELGEQITSYRISNLPDIVAQLNAHQYEPYDNDQVTAAMLCRWSFNASANYELQINVNKVIIEPYSDRLTISSTKFEKTVVLGPTSDKFFAVRGDSNTMVDFEWQSDGSTRQYGFEIEIAAAEQKGGTTSVDQNQSGCQKGVRLQKIDSEDLRAIFEA
ncbi:unnamed protein product [Toxocara canis]|uniref:CUB domain-containing protein n=1 Tax=Toxocara canis TaxID=6265 RepID=A0A3P7HBN8_TOXCA|nr:unnamed protein product [Toxocara canis]